MTLTRVFKGAAVATTITQTWTNVSPGSAATFTIASATGWPSTSSFVAVVDRGLATEEKVLCSSRSGTTVTVASGGRGFDDTTAVAHTTGATIEHDLDAATMTALVLHLNDTTQAESEHTGLLNNTRHDVTARHTFGAAYGTPAAPADSSFTAAATGSATGPPHSDHVHKLPAAAPRGVVYRSANVTTDQAGITTIATDITGMDAITVTGDGVRRFRVTLHATITKHTAGSVTLVLKEATTTKATLFQSNLADSEVRAFTASFDLIPTNASHTYKITGTASAGTYDLTASSTNPAYVEAEDTGNV